MKLDKLHIDQIRTRLVGQGMTIAGVLPAITGNLVGAPDAAGGQHESFGLEQTEPPALTIVTERAHHAVAIFQQSDHGAFHVDINAPVHAVVLQRANHFQAGAVADVRQTRIFVAAEIALKNSPVLGAVKERAPRFQFADTVGRFFCVQLGHAPVVQVLPAAHRIGEMDLPVVPFVHVRQGRRDAAFGHHGVRLAQKRLADNAHRHPRGRGFNRRAQSRAAGPDDQDIVLEGLIFRHAVLIIGKDSNHRYTRINTDENGSWAHARINV